MEIETHATGAWFTGERWTLGLGCDWLQLRPRSWNWIEFRVIELTPEWDRSMGSIKLSAALLGFGIHAAWTYDPDTKQSCGLRAMLAEIDLGEARVSINLSELEALRSDAGKWRGIPVESLGREHGEPGE